jgi:hypothetical protein
MNWKSHLPTVTFETTECTRCGGTGEYSYNPMHGTTCFKCRGRKVQASRAGAAARKAWDEVMATMARPVTELAVGTRVKTDRGWATVATVGRGTVTYLVADDRVKSIDVTFTHKPTCSVAYTPGATALVWNEDIYLAAIARVRRLKGATVREPATV